MTSYRPIRPRYPVFEHDWHPDGRKNTPRSGIRDWANPASISSDSSGMYACLHFTQSWRASRWATTQSMAEPTRNVSTCISISRVIADGASFVWRDESTR